MNITPIDWTILAVSFVLFLALAIYLNGLCRSVADYLVSGRKIRLWLGMGAGIAGEIGLVTIVGICEQGYLRGFGFVLIGLLTMCSSEKSIRRPSSRPPGKPEHRAKSVSIPSDGGRPRLGQARERGDKKRWLCSRASPRP